MTRLGISSIMGLASEADKPKKLYKTSNSEKYSRGRRGAPAKGVGRETGARVQIPLSPLTASSMTAQQTPELSDSGTQSRTEFIWPAERK